jgi:hypothetical protein
VEACFPTIIRQEGTPLEYRLLLFDLDGTPIIFEKNVAYRLSDTQKEDTQ